MKNLFTTTVILLTFYTYSNAQATWEKLFTNVSDDVFRSVKEVPTGGYIMAGYIADSSANDSDAFVVRMDLNGDTLWTYRYNNANNGKDLFYKIICTSDDGFLACGYTTGIPGANDDVLYIKLSDTGNEQWVKTYGGPGRERAQDVIETSTGYILVGYSTSVTVQYYDAIMIKIDFNGTVLWTKSYGGTQYEDANTVSQLSDGGFIFGGQATNGSNLLDQYLVRTNSVGDTLWTRRFGNPKTDNIESLVVVADGFILAGNTSSDSTGDDGYLVKTDTAGVVQWSKIFGGSQPDDFHSIRVTSDGGYILGGTTSSLGPTMPNMWLVKTDSQGNLDWQVTPGGANHDHGYDAIQTSDGGYLFVGFTSSFGFRNDDAYAVKFDGTGALPNKLVYISPVMLTSPLCAGPQTQVKALIRNFGNKPLSNISVSVDVTGGLTQTLNGNYAGPLVIGDVDTVAFTPIIATSAGTNYTFDFTVNSGNDVYPANNTLSQTVNLQACIGIDELDAGPEFSAYPNPSTGNIFISFEKHYSEAVIDFYDMLGSQVLNISIQHTSGMKKIVPVYGLPSGIYLMKVTADNLTGSKIMVVE